VGLVDKDKLEMLSQLKATSAQELTKMRQDWDSLQQKVRDLESQLDVSQAVVNEIISERDALRKTFGTRQLQLQADNQEDQTSIAELKSLLDEAASPAQLLNRFAEVTERSAERLAQKTEVCQCFFDIRSIYNLSYPSAQHLFTTPSPISQSFGPLDVTLSSSPSSHPQRQRLTRTRSGAPLRSCIGLYSLPPSFMPLFIPRPPVSSRDLPLELDDKAHLSRYMLLIEASNST
jgi:hypothetical protein